YVPLPQKGAYGLVIRQPIGVCAGIVPWNFPLTLMGTKVGPALAAGNTIVIKPASTTPLATLRCAELIQRAVYAGGKGKLPPGAINVVTGTGAEVGEALLAHPSVRRIAFTGSTEIGRHVMEVAGPQIKRITLELGGSDPMIVCEDADVTAAARMADTGRFLNWGQICLGVKRVFVHETVYGHGSAIWARVLVKANSGMREVQCGFVCVYSLDYGYVDGAVRGVTAAGVGGDDGAVPLVYDLGPKGGVGGGFR